MRLVSTRGRSSDGGAVVGSRSSLDLYRQARKAATWGIVVSLGLGLTKLLGGLFGHSLALVSDAAHSLVDAALSAALLGALLVAQRPPDREHPYGHARFEAVAGSGVALLLIVLALGIAREAIVSSGRNRTLPAAYTLAIALGGALIQEALYRQTRRVASQTGSAALLAAAWDYRLDALGSIAVVAGVAAARWGGPTWRWADHAAALVVASGVLWVGVSLLWGNIQDLMDRQAGPDLLEAVRDQAMAVEGVLGVETLRVRKVGLEYLVDIHVEVDPDHSVRDGHTIAHAVKDRLIGRLIPIRDVLVHVEPSPPSDSHL
jgi:cation diffusion facilitator family transporter